MHLTSDNCELVFFRIISGGSKNRPEILQLAAKRGEATYSVWVKPLGPMKTKEPLNMSASMQGQQLELFHCEKKVRSVRLKDALLKFLAFLKLSPKPVLLVTHSTGLVLMLLLRKILENSMADKFNGIIAAFADSHPILQKTFPRHNVVKFKFSIPPEDTILKPWIVLKGLQRLVCRHTSKSKIIESSISYEAAITQEMEKMCGLRIVERLKPLKSVLGWDNLITLAQARISYSAMDAVFRISGSEGLEEFLMSKQRNIKPARNFGHDTVIKIVNFFENKHAPDSGYVFDNEQRDVINEIGLVMETDNLDNQVLDTKDYSPEREHEKLTYDIDSLMQEQNSIDHQVPVNRQVPADKVLFPEYQRDRKRMEEWNTRLDPFY